ncbi:hypothetical protein ACXAT3_002726 [Clostridium sporogenes]
MNLTILNDRLMNNKPIYFQGKRVSIIYIRYIWIGGYKGSQ